MKVLHYTLGLPPARSGGLTQYSLALMLEQVKTDQVYLLYPGNYSIKKRTTYIRKDSKYKNIDVYKIVNPTIIPLLHGIKKAEYILKAKKVDEKNILDFFIAIIPDVFHVHTMMGLSPLILEIAKNMNIKIIYSTHDYYGLCLKTNFINNTNLPCDYNNCSCAECNIDAPNKLFLYLRNNRIILNHKSILKKIYFKKNSSSIEKKPCKVTDNYRQKSFLQLREYYLYMFSLIDYFCFNSSISKDIYLKFIPNLKGEIIHVTNSFITDNREKKEFSKRPIRLLFIGSVKPYKGFPVLLGILEKIYVENINNWQLDVWGSNEQITSLQSNISIKGYFESEEIFSIYKSADLLIVPSIWNETFSLVTLEALSFGVPVLLSSSVGAKDIVSKYNKEFVFSSSDELYLILKKILTDSSLLDYYNKLICTGLFDYTIERHSKEINRVYLQSKDLYE